ncbi:MAG: ATP-binding protein [Methanobrevibacter sp.]|nr:ATP-binding protein [Methanobrevibacter sp.]
MDIDLLGLQPHKVSRDLRGYSVFFYGEPKSGKTTIASKFPNALLLAFEKGYNALAGVMAQPINSWAEFIKVQRQLKDDKVKERFSTIIIDTADIAYSYCEKYVCANNGVDTIADVGYGKGYTLVGNEFDEKLRSIVQMGYGIVLISHATDKVFKDENGTEYNKIVPTLDKRSNNIVARMADIIGYSRSVTDAEGNDKTLLFMRGTQRFEAGSRFKYTPDYIEFTYNNLVNAIADAIDKQAAEDGKELFTDERENTYIDTSSHLDFDELMNTFNGLIEEFSKDEEKMATYYAPRITQIIDNYLGKGKKVNEMNRDQVEQLVLIIDDLKTL